MDRGLAVGQGRVQLPPEVQRLPTAQERVDRAASSDAGFDDVSVRIFGLGAVQLLTGTKR